MNARSSFVSALRALALPAIGALLLGACAGGTQPRPGASVAPAAAPAIPRLAPTQPPAGLGDVERFAWQQVVQLGAAFDEGNTDAFLARVSRGFYRGFSALEISLKKLLGNAAESSAVVAVREVTQEDGRVSVRAEWTRSVTSRDGSVDARRGETVFYFLKSDTSLRLLDYRGDTPFAIPGI